MFVEFGQITQTDAIAANSVAILPLAAMEAHGLHLPLATDALIANAIVDTAAKSDSSKTPFYRLPAIWLGASTEHADRAGTLTIEPEFLVSQIVAIGKGLVQRGIHRILLFNAHGGNIAAASIAVLKLRTELDMLAANAHWLDLGLPDDLEEPAPVKGDVHGGWMETSMLLSFAPHLVRMEKAAQNTAEAPSSSLFPHGQINWGWKMDDLAQGGWAGRPDLATPEIGAALVEHAAKRLCEVLSELAAADWPKAI